MAIEPKVLEKIGEVLDSGFLDPDKKVVDQENLFLAKGVCAFDLVDTLMAIELARLKLSFELQRQVVAEYEEWTVGTLQSYWQHILEALQHLNQEE